MADYTLEDVAKMGEGKYYTLADVAAMGPSRAWSSVPGEAISNIPKSAGKFFGGIADAVMHPIDTASGVADLAFGSANKLLPQSFRDWAEKQNSPEKNANMARATATADAVGGALKNRYGSMDGLKETLATDPVGAAADLSTVLSGGAGLATGGLKNALSTASKYTNPISAVAPVVNGVTSALGGAAKNTLGATTGVGPEAIKTAYTSGRDGKTAFMDNMTGKVDMTDALDKVKQNVAEMGKQKSNAYRSGMVDIKADQSVLKFDGIDKALQDAIGKVTFKGQVKNERGAQTAQKIQEDIAAWKSLDPAEFHTPEGLDALKQRIGGIMESIPFEERTARTVAGDAYNAIKNEINKQAPTYAKTMKEYADASDQIREIERALSVGKNASTDAAMRKLQSLTRNNVNTNYGNRLDLANSLEKQGGIEFMPDIAGQAMNSWKPRGLMGQAGGVGVAAATMANPTLAPLLLAQSPKAVGGAAYGTGKLAALLNGQTSKISPEQIRLAALLLNQSGQIPK